MDGNSFRRCPEMMLQVDATRPPPAYAESTAQVQSRSTIWTTGIRMDTAPVTRTSRQILKARQSRAGAWGFGADQDAVEPTCLAILALRHEPSVYTERALDALENLQNQDGSWPAFFGDEPEGCWTTALAVLCLLATRHETRRVKRGIRWLLNARGREANWLWRWKLRTVAVRGLRFAPKR